MTEKVRKPRSDSKMYQLPKDVLDQVNDMDKRNFHLLLDALQLLIRSRFTVSYPALKFKYHTVSSFYLLLFLL